MKPSDRLPVATPLAESREARAPRVSLIAWIDDPQRDPGALMVRIAKVMVGISNRWEAIIVHDPETVPLVERLAPWLRAPGVRLVAMPTGTSAGAAVREALSIADGDVAIVLDAPMQRCPECLAEVMQGWRDGADAVRLSPIGDPVWSPWPSTAVFRSWSASEGLSAEWLGGLRLFSRSVLEQLVPALESGVPEFTMWSVLSLPDRVAHPWGTVAIGEPEPSPAARPLAEGLHKLAGGAAGVVFSAATMLSSVSFGLSRVLVAHPFGRWAVVAALLLSSALPLVVDGNAPLESKRGELRSRPVQISGIGFTDDARA